jgi:putative endonuclease
MRLKARTRTKPADTPLSVKHQAYDKKGRQAEDWAAIILGLKGYTIVGRRVRNSRGELDLIAVRGSTLAFVEVKHRSTFETAIAAVTASQRRRIENAAHYWQSRRKRYHHFAVRFDIFAMNAPWRWQHLRDAWREGD